MAVSETVTTILAWVTLAVAVVYILETPWRLWRHRPGRWGPPLIEILLPVIFVLAAVTRGPAMTVRILTAALFCGGAALRYFARATTGPSAT